MTACAVEFIEKARGGKKIVKVCPTGRAGFGGSCGGMRLPSGYLGKMPAGRGELARGVMGLVRLMGVVRLRRVVRLLGGVKLR